MLCRTTAEGHSDQVVLQTGLLSPDGPGWKSGWDQRRQHQLLLVHPYTHTHTHGHRTQAGVLIYYSSFEEMYIFDSKYAKSW